MAQICGEVPLVVGELTKYYILHDLYENRIPSRIKSNPPPKKKTTTKQ